MQHGKIAALYDARNYTTITKRDREYSFWAPMVPCIICSVFSIIIIHRAMVYSLHRKIIINDNNRVILVIDSVLIQ